MRPIGIRGRGSHGQYLDMCRQIIPSRRDNTDLKVKHDRTTYGYYRDVLSGQYPGMFGVNITAHAPQVLPLVGKHRSTKVKFISPLGLVFRRR